MTFYDENIAFEEKKSGAKSGTRIYLVANIVYICRVHVVSSRTFSLSDLCSNRQRFDFITRFIAYEQKT